MIVISFKRDNQAGFIKIDNKYLYYGKVVKGVPTYVPIDKNIFVQSGVIKEYPELKDKTEDEAKTIAEQRLKDKIKLMNSEEEIYQYVLHELRLHGNIPVMKQKAGFRPEIIKNGC
jgi:hypothetical protein